MRCFINFLLCCLVLISCKSKKDAPDVSGIKVPLTVERFDKDMFAMDTNNLQKALPLLAQKYPDFMPLFMGRIINADPAWQADTTAMYLKGFISAYVPVYDTAQLVFGNFNTYTKEIEQGLKYVKYYFPAYPLPQKVITYIGPIDGYGDVITSNALAVGLHQHLGSGYSMYNHGYVQETYPEYVTRRFIPENISVNAMRNIVDDMYRQRYDDKALIIQMVENGKKLYLLEKLQPEKADNLLIGYTEKQMQECYDNEARIWDLFIKSNYLQSTDVNIFRNYVGEGPKTPELGENAPGNIGSFSGWQIVKAYMKKFPDTGLDALMKLDAETVYTQSKYKPRL